MLLERGGDVAVAGRLGQEARTGDALGSWFTAVAFLLLSGPVGVPIRYSAAALAGVATLALALRWTSARDVYIPSWCILYVAWCALTLLWSDDRAQTLIDAMSLLLLTVAAVAAANTFSARSIVRGIVHGGVAAAVLSAAVAVVAPAQGIVHDGVRNAALQGIYVQRNLLASTMALGLVTAVSSGWALGRRRVARVVSVVVLAACALAAQSTTAVASLLAAFAIAAAVAAVRRFPRSDRSLVIVGLAALVAVSVIVVTSRLTGLLESVGRDPTLTGRTTIWTAVWTEITKRPWLGYGWGGAWGDRAPAGSYIRSYIGYSIEHSHNGALDVWVQAGALGLVLLLAALVHFGAIAGRAYFRGPTQLGIWPLALMSLVLCYDVSESQFSPPSNWWYIIVTAVVLLLREAASVPSSAAVGKGA